MRAAILLAAGASRRFGRRDKLAERLGSRSLFQHALANVRASGVQRIIVVTAGPRRITGVTQVRPRSPGDGVSASLAAGLEALRPIEREVLIFLADMPFARTSRLRLQPGAEAVRPHFKGRPGHPVLIRAHVARLRLAKGDRGLSGTLGAVFVRGTAANLFDIDTLADLRRARRRGPSRAHLRSLFD
jgi:molybdenum cofactor cytidylyltransferase